jgi:hypothetical protein
MFPSRSLWGLRSAEKKHDLGNSVVSCKMAYTTPSRDVGWSGYAITAGPSSVMIAHDS